MTGRATHGHTRGRTISPTMMSWLAMRNRCYNPTNEKYPSYGAIGVTVCERWRISFGAFLEDMGERPAGTTIDRYPNKGGHYEPANCRWATPKQQAENRVRSFNGRADRTHCPSGHPYSGSNLRLCPNGNRKCKECERQRALASRERRREVENA